MTHFNFLTSWGTSPENGPRMDRHYIEIDTAMSRKIFTILFVLFLSIGQMWGADPVASAAPGNNKEYVIAAYVNSKYYALPNGSVNGGTISGTEITLTAAGKVSASDATGKTWTMEVGTGDNAGKYYLKYQSGSDWYYLYKNGTGASNYNFAVNKTSKNYWSFTTNGTGYTVAASGRGSNNINIQCNSGTFRCYSSATPIILLEVASSCSNSVTVAKGTPTNATISVSSTSVATCSSTASDRYVTVSVAPSSCYAAPVKASVTQSGTTATWVSGPDWNSTTSQYDYVYSFAQNATGTTTFNISLSTKTTYTVNYNKGNATGATGDASSDTKTCGDALTLPSSALFTRAGYTQQGWSTAQAGTTKTYNLGGSYTTDAATTLYPYWQANSYSVTWKVNNTNYSAGGSISVNHDSHIASLPTAPNPASYCGDKFVGWTTDAEYVHGSSPLYTTASQFPNATTDQVFYAVFADYDE